MSTRMKIGVGLLVAAAALGTAVTVASAQGGIGGVMGRGFGMDRGAGMQQEHMASGRPGWAGEGAASAAGQGRGRMAGGMGASGMVPAAPADAPAVTDELRTALQAAYDEEALARATYLAVIDELGNVAPFANIARSELVHLDAVKQVAANHGITLVDHSSTVSSPSTLEAACALGVSVEQSDIALYDQYLPDVKAWSDVTQVFTHLQAASTNRHLPAFSACA